MFEAQMLFGAAGGTTVVYSPWFPRRGDNVICTIDPIASSTATVKVELFTKAVQDTGDGANATGSMTGTTPGTRVSNEWTGVLKDMVRYRFTCAGTAAQWMLFRMLPPVWFDTVKG